MTKLKKENASLKKKLEKFNLKKINAQKFTAKERREAREATYKSQQLRSLDKKREHDRRKELKEIDHQNSLEQKEHATQMKFKGQTALMDNKTNHMHELRKVHGRGTN